MINSDMFSLGNFIILAVIIGLIGWGVIEVLIRLFSFVTISIG
jgi:hypothetical protein